MPKHLPGGRRNFAQETAKRYPARARDTRSAGKVSPYKVGFEGSSLLWIGDKHALRIDSLRAQGAEYPDKGSSAEVYTNPDPLKYVELDGNLERGSSVLKARGVRHATDVRRMNFTATGIEVGQPFKGLRGVLTGLPTPLGKAKE